MARQHEEKQVMVP